MLTEAGELEYVQEFEFWWMVPEPTSFPFTVRDSEPLRGAASGLADPKTVSETVTGAFVPEGVP
jgi:hypothetical protein